MGTHPDTSHRVLAAGRTAPAARPVTVLVADNHAVFSDALAEVIAATPGFHQVGEAASGPEMLRLVEALAPDLALIEARLPGLDVEAVAQRLAALSPRTVVVLMSVEALSEVPQSTVPVLRLRKQELSPRVLQRLWSRSRRRAQPARRS